MNTALLTTLVVSGLAMLALLVLSHPRRIVAAPGVGPSGLDWQPPVLVPSATALVPTPAAAGESSRVTHLTRMEAEDLLDWLEATGKGRGRLSYTDDQGFTVSWC